ncbi:unnamed protein product, partial [Ectocarpus sp. 8 AP-2014]
MGSVTRFTLQQPSRLHTIVWSSFGLREGGITKKTFAGPKFGERALLRSYHLSIGLSAPPPVSNHVTRQSHCLHPLPPPLHHHHHHHHLLSSVYAASSTRFHRPPRCLASSCPTRTLRHR